MQPYFIPTNDSSDSYPFVSTKISSTSTADSYAGPSSFSNYLESSEEPEDRVDPDLLMRFNSLGLDDDEEQSAGPRRHASGTLPVRPPPKVRLKLSHGPLQLTGSFKAPRNPRNTLSSSKVVNSSLAPPGLMLPPQNPSFYIPYSTNSLPQFVGTVPMCSMPQYYVWQPEIVPISVVYDYPKPHCKPEPRRFFSSKKQVFPLVTEPLTTFNTELSEKAIMLIKEYERTGNFKRLEGEIANLAKIQSGSRFLQKEVEKAGTEFFNFILQQVLPIPNS
eukprot:TRINITY_DN9521_c0_g1_i4.p1 TRINITY_DN9521_c0_g1~~TRINITY_DN9521_c0_g1_i4.p1  ORF type:complete len:276 (-),score=58.04 TRINITY_DN9521_c0_g1_i4:1019-1846(-)